MANTDDPARELLDRAAWLKRLCTALARDVDAAEDLSQETLALALRDAAALRGPRLAAWLRTTARQLNLHRRRNEAARESRERRAARPEASDSDAHTAATLDLQERVTAELKALAPTFRIVLTLRYVDGLSTSEVALALGLAPATVRQRCTRGLAQLRAALAPELERRPELERAFLVLAAPPRAGGTPALPSALAALIVMKPLAFAAAVLAVCIAALLAAVHFAKVPSDPSVSPVGQVSAPLTEREVGSATGPLPAQAAARALVGAPDAGAAVEAPPVSAPGIRVVDAEDRPVSGARAAWVDTLGRVRPLELDASGRAPFPENALGALVCAQHAELALAKGRIATEASELVLALEPCVAVRGRLEAPDGSPWPGVRLRLDPDQALLRTQLPWPRRVAEQLAALQLGERAIEAVTAADGSFEFPAVHPQSSGALHLPSSFVVVGSGDASVDYALPSAGPMVIRATRSAYAFGRILWSGDERSIAGGISALVQDGTTGQRRYRQAILDATGHFEVRLPTSNTSNTPTGHTAAELHLTVIAEGPHRTASSDLRFDLTGLATPVDLGTLRIDRAATQWFRIERRDGRPLLGARVVGASVAVSDREGLAAVGVPADGRIAVVTDEQLVLHEVAPGPGRSQQPEVIPIEPGPSLRLVLRELAAPQGHRPPQLDVAWHTPPFAVQDAGEGPAHSTLERALIAHFGEALVALDAIRPSESGSLALTPQGSAPLTLPGLRPGARLEVTLRSALAERPTWRQAVDVPAAPGALTVEVAPAPSALGHLVIDARSSLGTPLVDLRVALTPFDAGESCSVPTDIWPLQHGRYAVEVRAAGHVAQQLEVEVGPGTTRLAVTLESLPAPR